MESLRLSATAPSLLQAAVQGGAVGHSHAPARPAVPGHRQSLDMGRAWAWAEPCFNGTTLGGQILPGLPDQH